MAMTLISEQVLGSSAASVTFSSIPSTYKDLVLEIVGTDSSTGNGYVKVNLNSDSSSNYSRTMLSGSGSAASSEHASNDSSWFPGIGGNGNVAASTMQIMSYSNTSAYKTALGRYVTDNIGTVRAEVSLWRSTAAVTSLTILASSTTMAAGSTFRLWGVA